MLFNWAYLQRSHDWSVSTPRVPQLIRLIYCNCTPGHVTRTLHSYVMTATTLPICQWSLPLYSHLRISWPRWPSGYSRPGPHLRECLIKAQSTYCYLLYCHTEQRTAVWNLSTSQCRTPTRVSKSTMIAAKTKCDWINDDTKTTHPLPQIRAVCPELVVGTLVLPISRTISCHYSSFHNAPF